MSELTALYAILATESLLSRRGRLVASPTRPKRSERDPAASGSQTNWVESASSIRESNAERSEVELFKLLASKVYV